EEERRRLQQEIERLRRENQKHERKKANPSENLRQESAANRLSTELVDAKGVEQERLLRHMRETKGVQYTEALALAVPRLEGQPKQKAREALVNRFTRLKPDSLLRYIEQDPDAEIRRAAVLASAMREIRGHFPAIIARLDDKEPSVVRAACAALK